MGANKLKLNSDKMEILHVRQKFDPGIGIIHLLDGVALFLKDQVHSLEVVLNSGLLLYKQVAVVARCAFCHFWLLNYLQPFLDRKNLATVVHTLETSKLDYCNTLYVVLSLKAFWKLQLVLNTAARMLTRVSCRDHSTPVLLHLY